MKKVVILGASGMLGSTVLDVFAQDGSVSVTATVRGQEALAELRKVYPSVTFTNFDAEAFSEAELHLLLSKADYCVNAIGIIKPYIHDTVAKETMRATKVNALFPHILASVAESSNTKVLQIATDCTYSGNKGNYVEDDLQDALDVYGKSKSIGEVSSENMHHIRCSIIGPERKSHVSLLDWFLGQPKSAEVNGYTNHMWNGVTTLTYAKICLGIIKNSVELPKIQHIVPSGKISKADLLKSFAEAYNRSDITIKPGAADKVIDRTLSTNNQAKNLEIWEAAGYNTPPTVEEMVIEMSRYTYIPSAP